MALVPVTATTRHSRHQSLRWSTGVDGAYGSARRGQQVVDGNARVVDGPVEQGARPHPYGQGG
ncbi:MAG: hypothetical protein H0U77_11950 [Nocardioidaceae bacterium]|nr:hypothetical protein [Nocardioidaceae bacterium]